MEMPMLLNSFAISFMKKIILTLVIILSTNISFADMLQKSQGNTQALPSNNAVVPTAQNIVINVNPNSIYTSGSAALSITGAQGTATYSITSGSCTISGSTITAGSSAGTCTVQATVPASTYFLASSATTSITVNALQNQTLTTVANPSSFNPSGNSTLSTTGAQGSVSYSVQSGSCSVSGTTVTASAAGTCVIRANAAATTGYLAGSATVSITVTSPPPDSGPVGSNFPQWAYFNMSMSDSAANATIANNKCATIGAGWRLPTYAETGPGTQVVWLSQNIGRGVQLFNSSGISNLQNAGYTTNYNYPYGQGFTIRKIACYHP
jgi:hypothetical protein